MAANNIALLPLDRESPVKSYLSAYAQRQQLEQQQQAAQRAQAQEARAQSEFTDQQKMQAIDRAGAILDGIQDGDQQGFAKAIQWGVQNQLIDPQAASQMTVADLPRLRAMSEKARALIAERQKSQMDQQKFGLEQQRFGLDRRKTEADIAQSYASADAAKAQAEYIRSGKGAAAKPLPQGLQGRENDLLEKVQIASNNNADVNGFIQKIDNGELDPGLMKNLYERSKSFLGTVDPNDTNARNYSTFITTMERLRNESLRLNRGVQTDSDAQRAWAELFQHINDKTIVRDQLARIAKLNERAARQHAGLVRNQRKNYFGEKYQEPDWADLGVDPSLFEAPPQEPTSFVWGGAGGGPAGQPVSGGAVSKIDAADRIVGIKR
jgi:hypothetical protein